jgi:hypothetical protein
MTVTTELAEIFKNCHNAPFTESPDQPLYLEVLNKRKRIMEGKKDNRTDPEPQEDNWIKKLGAIPADQSYKESPDATQIETALSTLEEQEAPIDLVKEMVCIYLTKKMFREYMDAENVEATLCPAKRTLVQAKAAFKDTIGDPKKTEVWTNYLPCHICPKHFQAATGIPNKRKLQREQIEFLREFDLLNEKPITRPEYTKTINHDRKRAADRLEKRKLIRTVRRLLPNPIRQSQPEPTWIANLTVAGFIASTAEETAKEFVKDNASKALLEKPADVVVVYLLKLREEMERLKQFIQTKKEQRDPERHYVTLTILELQRQHDLIMKYIGL